MRSFEELLQESSTIHGHHCAGQVLGVRMAMIGCREVGIDEPKNCKKLIIYVEMDRCATDAVQAVTGCSLGKRTLKFLDYGKMAATFIHTETQQAVRILAKDDARAQVPRYAESTENWREAQKQAYRVMPEALLFSIRSVVTQVSPRDMPAIAENASTARTAAKESISIAKCRFLGARSVFLVHRASIRVITARAGMRAYRRHY